MPRRRGQQHHGLQHGHPPDLLLLQCPHRHHRPGHLPCGECAGGPRDTGAHVSVCESGPLIYRAPRTNGTAAAHHLSVGPCLGLSLPLCQMRGRGPCSGRWCRAVVGIGGPRSKRTLRTFSLRLSFCLCKMGQNSGHRVIWVQMEPQM